MGKRGPAKTPTELAVVKGERKDRLNRNEPQPSATDVDPPGWLSADARAVWARLAPDLQAKGVLTAWDVDAFASFCDAAARRATAAQELEEQGAVIDLPVFNKNGELTGHRVGRNPWALELKDADAQLHRWGARFGLTPSDRTSLSVGEERRGGSTEDLLTG